VIQWVLSIAAANVMGDEQVMERARAMMVAVLSYEIEDSVDCSCLLVVGI
jgi:hypothetical protein